jgi:rhamnosyl/mannosyltransferase
MNSYVLDGKTGLLVPPGDVQALRNAICRLWENPALAREMGRAGREFMEKNYSQERVVESTTVFLRNVAAASKSVDR